MSEVETAIVLRMMFWADGCQLSAFTTEIFGLATYCWYFHPSPFFPSSFCSVVSVLLCCKPRVFLQVKILTCHKRHQDIQCSVASMLQILSVLVYVVLFIIQESLLNVYLLEVPDMQNWSICTQDTKVAKVKCI